MLVIRTLAPGITPWASLNAPLMLPRVSWAQAGIAAREHIRSSAQISFSHTHIFLAVRPRASSDVRGKSAVAAARFNTPRTN